MKRFYLFIVTFFLTLGIVQAAAVFHSDTKYRFCSKVNVNGALALGQYHDSSAYLYYFINPSTPEDGWWYILGEGRGYQLRNALTKQYITYNPKRIEQVAKGLVLTDKPDGDKSLWNIETYNGAFVIKNVYDSGQWFNLRLDGSFLMGTYPGSGTRNELFSIFDEKGNEVIDKGDEDVVGPEDGSAFSQTLDSLRLNNKQLVYDKRYKTYMYPLPASLRNGGNFEATVFAKYKSGYEHYSLSIAGHVVDKNNCQITINNVDCNTLYTIGLLDEKGDVCSEVKLKFTFLPIVEVNVPRCNGYEYTKGSIRVTDAMFPVHDSVFVAAFKYRGATAQRMEKKSYAVKLYDAKGHSVDRSFLGFRSDNHWILDAMAIDEACMRNRVSTDLWNDFSTPPYYKDREPKARTGTRGKFVEVLLNGSYNGLYCMTEKMDRKQLKLKKFASQSADLTTPAQIHGLLYKSKQWTYEVLMGHDLGSQYFPHRDPVGYANNLGVESWAQYEIKYPDFEDEAVDWKPLYDVVKFVATSSDWNFTRNLKEYIDYPVLRDYYLFMDLLLTTDNHGKNMYFFVYDNAVPEGQKLGIAPWDLDGTWGIRWDGSRGLTRAKQDFDKFIWNYEHGQHTAYYRLQHGGLANEWNEDLRTRYAELRTKDFDKDSLIRRFTNYAELFADSHADQREIQRWSIYHNNIQGAVRYIKQWVSDRIDWLDSKYDYDPTISSVEEMTAQPHFQVIGGQGKIAITTEQSFKLPIYDLTGKLVRKVQLSSGLQIVDGLQPGVYVVNHKKVLVR